MHPWLRRSALLAILSPIVPIACGSTESSPPAVILDAGPRPKVDSGDDTPPPSPVDSGPVDTGPPDAGPPKLVTPIKHVIVIVKENHTFDNFFGSFPGAAGTATCHSKAQGDFPCPHAPDKPHDLCHEHECALKDWNNGAMDGWDDSNEGQTDNLAYAQYQEADIPNYWQYARHYGLGDHFFSSMLGPSFPGHLFVIAGQAGWALGNPPVDFGVGSLHPFWGCDEASGDTCAVLNNKTCTIEQRFPCFDIPSVPDILPTGVDWKFYGSNWYVLNEIWSMFNAVRKVRSGPGWSKVVHIDTFDSDIDNKRLAPVTWLVNQDLRSEHPGYNISLCEGENWTVDRINKVMKSDYWKDTVILFTFDDFGGWYDHVAPPRQYGCDPTKPYGLGFRLPLLIISPYVKPGSIFSEVAEQASVPKFIGRIFNATKTLSDLDPAAQDGQANDLLNAFDFNQKPLDPLVLPTRTCP